MPPAANHSVAVPAHVVLHDFPEECLRPHQRRGYPQGARVARRVRLPDRVHHQRVPQQPQAVRHHQGRKQPRLQRLRGGHAYGLRHTVRREVHGWLAVCVLRPANQSDALKARGEKSAEDLRWLGLGLKTFVCSSACLFYCLFLFDHFLF